MSKGYSGHFKGTKGAISFPPIDKQSCKFNASGYNDADSDSVGRVDDVNELDITGHVKVPTKGVPNSVTIIIDRDNRVRERYYDENGDAYLDIDYNDHNNPKNHPVPHQHRWIKGEKGDIRRSPAEKIIRKENR